MVEQMVERRVEQMVEQMVVITDKGHDFVILVNPSHAPQQALHLPSRRCG